MLAVSSSMLGLVNSARGVFEVDLERADMQQRARVSMDALFRDLVMAGGGQQVPSVAPFRRGVTRSGFAGFGVRRSSVRAVCAARRAAAAVTITYRTPPGCGRRAAIDEVRRTSDRTAPRRSGRGASVRILRRRRTADLTGAFCRWALGAQCRGCGSLRRGSPGDTAGSCDRPSASGPHVRGFSARRSRGSHRRVTAKPESRMTLIIALFSLVLLSALGTSLAVVMNTELRAASNYTSSREAMYAADGALEIAAHELLAVADWNALLVGRRSVGFRRWTGHRCPPAWRRHHGRSRRRRRTLAEQRAAAVGLPTTPCGACLHSGGSVRGHTSSRGLPTTPRRTTTIRRPMAGV